MKPISISIPWYQDAVTTGHPHLKKGPATYWPRARALICSERQAIAVERWPHQETTFSAIIQFIQTKKLGREQPAGNFSL